MALFKVNVIAELTRSVSSLFGEFYVLNAFFRPDSQVGMNGSEGMPGLRVLLEIQ